MWAIKKTALVIALMLISVTALAAPRYNTREATTGDFSISGVYSGSVIYQQSQWINNRVSGAYVSEVMVETEQTVAAGDVLLTYTAPVSEVDVARAETALRQATDDYEYELSRRNKLIAEYRDASTNADNDTDARIYELMAQREEILFESYRAGAEANIVSLTYQRDAALAADEPKPVTAGIDGTVSYITSLEPGQGIDNGRDLAGIFTPETLIIRVSNGEGALKYGMKVSLRLDGSDGPTMITGTVVSSDNVLPGALQSGMAYVLPDTFPGTQAFRSATVTAETLCVQNVVVVSAATLQYQNGKCYVRVLDENDAVHIRYVDPAISDSNTAWIIQGVEPGDKLIAK